MNTNANGRTFTAQRTAILAAILTGQAGRPVTNSEAVARAVDAMIAANGGAPNPSPFPPLIAEPAASPPPAPDGGAPDGGAR